MIDTEAYKQLYTDNNNKPIAELGKCPSCGSPRSKIYWGWAGVYYNLMCSNGHRWTYRYPDENGVNGGQFTDES